MQVNLRDQLTDELQQAWYYDQVKWGLKVNRKTVVFDKDFEFRVYRRIDGDESQWFWVELYIDGERWDLVGVYGEDRWLDNPTEILKDILLYIVNRI